MAAVFTEFEISDVTCRQPKASHRHTSERTILFKQGSLWLIKAAEEYLNLVIINVKSVFIKQGNMAFSIVCIPDAKTQAENRGHVSDKDFLEADIIKHITPKQEELFGEAAAEEDFRILHMGRKYILIINDNEFSITPLLAWKI